MPVINIIVETDFTDLPTDFTDLNTDFPSLTYPERVSATQAKINIS